VRAQLPGVKCGLLGSPLVTFIYVIGFIFGVFFYDIGGVFYRNFGVFLDLFSLLSFHKLQ
jgi:hypothetical protein